MGGKRHGASLTRLDPLTRPWLDGEESYLSRTSASSLQPAREDAFNN